jgi:hypothetical protein
MPNEATDVPSDGTLQNPTRRFRIGLKWLLLFVAVVAIALGAMSEFKRRSRAMLAFNNSMLSTIEEEFRMAPPNTKFIEPEASRLAEADFKRRTREKNFDYRQRDTPFFSGAMFNSLSGFETQLDVSNLLTTPGAQQTAVQILGHYEKRLAATGLQSISTASGPDSATSISQIPEHGVSVIADVFVDRPAKTAKVRIIFIQIDRVSIW